MVLTTVVSTSIHFSSIYFHERMSDGLSLRTEASITRIVRSSLFFCFLDVGSSSRTNVSKSAFCSAKGTTEGGGEAGIIEGSIAPLILKDSRESMTFSCKVIRFSFLLYTIFVLSIKVF